MSKNWPVWLICQYIILTLLITSVELSCVDTKHCSCRKGSVNPSQYIYDCKTSSAAKEGQIKVAIERNFNNSNSKDFIRITCMENYDNDYIKLFQNMNDSVTENMELFEIKHCPLPNVSFAEIFNVFKAQHVKHFAITSAKGFDGSEVPTFEAFHFANLSSMETLHLINHKFKELQENLFEKVTTLKELKIISNPTLKILPSKIFDPLKNLITISLLNNNLSYLDENTFRSNSKLKKLSLDGNKLNDLPGSVFSTLIELTSLSANANNMKTLNDGIFDNLVKLIELHLTGNQLIRVPNKLFNKNLNLKVINMRAAFHKEKFKGLPSQFFTNLKTLKSLYLDVNNLSTIPAELFRDVTELEELYLGYNRLAQLDNTSFDNLKELKMLDLSHNRLTSITTRHLENSPSLVELNLSYNELTMEIDPSNPHSSIDDCCNESLKTLDLSYNLVTRVFEDWTRNFNKLTKLNLSYNKITHLKTEDFKFAHVKDMIVSLNNNLITTIDLDLDALKKYKHNRGEIKTFDIGGNPLTCDCNAISLSEYLSVKTIIHIKADNVVCNAPDQLMNKSLEKLSPLELKCPVLECPTHCSCNNRTIDRTIEINCTSTDQTKFPERLPVPRGYCAELFFANNKLTSPDGLQNLINNYNITKIVLSYNKLEHFNIELQKALKFLELDNNKLTSLNKNVIKKLEAQTFTHLTLHNNPWECNCKLQDLWNFIQTYYLKIHDHLTVKCADDERVIKNLTIGNFCDHTSYITILISVSLAVLGLLTGVFIAVYFVYQYEIKVWMFAHKMCLWLFSEESLDADKEYDAFISFSHRDENFVNEHLIPQLENNDDYKYKLCVHYRHFKVGEFIPSQIINAVENSRRTIIVLTPNFLESVWGRMEFRTAHLQAIKEGCARVIVILLEDVDDKKLDPELKTYITMNTYVKWGDPWFWKKLKYALPHPQLSRVQKRSRTRDRELGMKLLNEEKKAVKGFN